jgi:hypothetical protein
MRVMVLPRCRGIVLAGGVPKALRSWLCAIGVLSTLGIVILALYGVPFTTCTECELVSDQNQHSEQHRINQLSSCRN